MRGRRDRARRCDADRHAGGHPRQLRRHRRDVPASLASEPVLILAALAAVYIVLGVLYESYIHPITILSTLPSAGDRRGAGAAAVQHRVQHHRAHRRDPAHRHREEERDHDDRLCAGGAARQGQAPREAIYEASLLRFRPIMMTTMAAMLGALPLGLRQRRWRGDAPAAGHRDRRWPDREPGTDALHDPGHLPVPGSLRPLVQPRLGRACIRRTPAAPAAPAHGHPRMKAMRKSLVAVVAAGLHAPARWGPITTGRRPRCRRSSRRPRAGSPPQPREAASGSPWWSVYDDPVLDELEQQIDVSNQTLKASEAAWREARALVSAGARGLPARPLRLSCERARARAAPQVPSPTPQPAASATECARRPCNEFSLTGTRLLGPGHLGQDPPHRGEPGRERQGQRGGAGRRAPVGPGHPRHRLRRAARRR